MCHLPRRLAVVALLLGMWATTATADVIILKDGFTLHGKVTREMSTLIDDRTGEPLITAKVGGLNLVDDGPRYMIYSAHSRRVGDVDNQIDIRKDLVRYGRKTFPGTTEFPNGARLSEFTEFDKDWKRTFKATNPRGYSIVTQQIAGITPYYLYMSSSHKFTTWYMTRELGPERVDSLLKTHPDLVEEDGMPNLDRRLKRLEFFLQAKWYDYADQLVDQWLKDFDKDAEAKKRIQEAKARLRNLMGEFIVEEVEVARSAGRHRLAQDLLKRFPTEGVEARVLDDVAKLRARYEASVTQYDSARRHLRQLSEGITEDKDRFLAQAAASILNELHFDNMERIETFLAQAEQAELDVQKGRKPTLSPAEILSLAVTGWSQGKNAAETKVESALRFWQARSFLLSYMTSTDRASRRELLANYQKEPYALAFDELAQLLTYLPPVEAETVTDPGKVLQRKTPGFRGHDNGVEYELFLPPEYQHGRPYPLLIALHHTNETPDSMIKRLRPMAERHGYILVAPKWSSSLGTAYGYTEEEQSAVTGVLKHVKRLVQVDSDRVFLIGVGEGATLAFDIGVSTPDLFAGIIPFGAPPSWTGLMLEYWRNAQILPYYVVMGSMTGEAFKAMRRVLQEWMPKGYPALTVLYKGRGFEWFAAELPTLFDWMSRKKRAEPWRELGSVGHEFRTARQSNNRFYWLSTDEIKARHLIENRKSGQLLNPARLNAKVVEGNQIFVTTFGLAQLTVWLSPKMVDFDRPVTITVNGKYKWNNSGKPLKPDVAMMLEDFFDRNDRQRLFYYQVDFTTPEGR